MGPAFGLSPLTAGAERKVKLSSAVVAELPATVSTVTSTTPEAIAGATADIENPDVTVTSLDGDEPKSTVAPGANPVPLIVTDVPPDVGPALGLSDMTVGAP